jgi:hypothetical protein
MDCRNGIIHFGQGATASSQVYGLSTTVGIVLDLYSVLTLGDVASLTWSIGKAPPPSLLNLLGNGIGLSGSHNIYEGDASGTRGGKSSEIS